jgi:hypothetical protein
MDDTATFVRHPLCSCSGLRVTNCESQITRFLTATVAKLKFELSSCKHRTSHFSNRNKKPLPPRRSAVADRHSWFQTLREPRRRPGELSRVRAPEFTNHRLSNRNKVKIEIAVSYSKQTMATNSNRNYFRGSRMSNPEPFPNSHESEFTIHALYDTFLRGAKQNWRNPNHA